MDAVEKALQRARGEDSRRIVGSSGGKRQANKFRPTANRANLVPGHDETGPALKVVYEQTRVLPVSESTLRRHRLLAGFHREPISDTYRMLRAQVLKYLSEHGGSTVAVCSSNAGEGKTVTAINLSISLALDPNHTALLVDLDLRRPRLQTYFGIQVEKGLCDYLEGKASLDQCLVNPGIDRLVLLPVRRPILNSSELLSSSRVTGLLQELAARYSDRVVLFDLPPLLASDDSLVILPQVDASLFVVQEGKTHSGEIQRGFNLLSDYRLIGTVLNRSETSNAHPYY